MANKKLVSQGIFLCMTLTLICISQDSALLCALNGKFWVNVKQQQEWPLLHTFTDLSRAMSWHWILFAIEEERVQHQTSCTHQLKHCSAASFGWTHSASTLPKGLLQDKGQQNRMHDNKIKARFDGTQKGLRMGSQIWMRSNSHPQCWQWDCPFCYCAAAILLVLLPASIDSQLAVGSSRCWCVSNRQIVIQNLDTWHFCLCKTFQCFDPWHQPAC